MSIDAIFPKKNVGSSTSPIWEEFVYKTLANSVYMDDTFDKTLTDNIDELVNTLDNKVSKEQTINNQPLSSNITLTAENVGAISALEKGTSNGIAELDETGKVPVSQLPSYVDDVIEGYYHNGKFYQDLGYETELENNSNKIYVDFLTEKIYRWSGSMYIEISPSLILGEISSTAFRGDHGKIAYEHSQSLHAPADAEKNIITSIQINGENIEPNAERVVNIIIPDLESKVNKNTFDISSLKSSIEQQNNKIDELSAIIVNLDGTDITQEAADNTEYRAGTLTSLTITLPSDVPDTYESSIVFSSGDVPTNGVFPADVKWNGTDVVENNGAVALVPIENRRYNISLWYDGKYVNAVSRGVDDEPTE